MSCSSLILPLVIESNVCRHVKRLRSDIDAIRPGESSTLDEEFCKKLRILQRLKDRTFEPLRYIDVLLGAIIKARSDNESAYVLCFDDFR